MGVAISKWTKLGCVIWLASATACPEIKLDQGMTPEQQAQKPADDKQDEAPNQEEPAAEADDDAGAPTAAEPEQDASLPPPMVMGDEPMQPMQPMQPMGEPPVDGDAGMGELPPPAEARLCQGEITTMCCGDEICGGPENHDNCAADCDEGEEAVMEGTGEAPPDMPTMGETPTGEPPTTPRSCTASIKSMCCGDDVCDGPETVANCADDC